MLHAIVVYKCWWCNCGLERGKKNISVDWKNSSLLMYAIEILCLLIVLKTCQTVFEYIRWSSRLLSEIATNNNTEVVWVDFCSLLTLFSLWPCRMFL